MKSLAIIPARKGSRRFPDKNKSEFLGATLIGHALREALKSNIDKIVLSSNDEDILDRIGVITVKGQPRMEKIRRPDDLSKDDSRIEDEAVRILGMLGYQDFDLVVILLPTSPLRTYRDINNVLEVMKNENLPALVSVNELYQPNGAICCIKKEVLLEENMTSPVDGTSYSYSFYPKGMGVYKMPNDRSIDVNYLYDLRIAEATKRNLVF